MIENTFSVEGFKRLSLGGKIVVCALAVQIISLFMPWVDLGFITASGFNQQGFLLFIPTGYLIYLVVMNKEMNRVLGLVLSGASALGAIYFMTSKSLDMFGSSANVSGSGLYLFLLASLVFVAGIYMYKPFVMDEKVIVETVTETEE